MEHRHRKKLPIVWLMTDERVDEAVQLAAAARLPRGRGGIVFRHYRTGAEERRALFMRFRAIARRRRLLLMLGGSAGQAADWGADGWHGGDRRRGQGRMLHSVAAHDAREVVAAGKRKADFLFLSPLFPTRSHPGTRALGKARFAMLARQAGMPVMALGGVRARDRRLLRGLGAAGWGAIDGLLG
ncbi:thiamine phosphate synthase [Sphingobium cloacae]|uniref:Thiamine monophosphate synthase n=1 Tax=Sphingobium cloacae TaxID=120107 RepID=A0A1E1F435_9SPHN|nr:thiamine phosphate synthase [Sphingobium cloacae]BAV65283.1 thiamine monophosphate synthase [Sphingobium cloacae]